MIKNMKLLSNLNINRQLSSIVYLLSIITFEIRVKMSLQTRLLS